jgi:putative sigma-54 modulation protein
MDVHITALGVELTDDLAEFCRDHIVEPLRRIYDREGPRLEIEVSDENGEKGGVDKRCRITFMMPHTRTINVSQMAADPYTAVDLAARRFSRLVKRYKGWKLIKQRHPAKYFVARMEHENQPGEPASPEDVTVEEDSLAAVEEREARERRMESAGVPAGEG